MSRAFHPPDTLSKDDIRTIADVRREIWTNSMKGLVVGTLTGFSLYSIASIGQHRFKLWKLSPQTLNRNTALLSVLLGGAIGSFIMSVTTGKNEVHNLHPIFTIGASNRNKLQEEIEDETISTHLSLKELSILQQQQQQQQQQHTNNNGNVGTIDRTQLERNRLYRRATLTKKMEVQGNRFNYQDASSSSSSSSSSLEVSSDVPVTPTPHVVEADGKLLSDQEVIKSRTQQR